MQYRPFVIETPASCIDPDPVQDVDASPMEGCICLDGMLLSNGEDICVAPEQCGCYNNHTQRYTPVSACLSNYHFVLFVFYVSMLSFLDQ